MAIAYLHCYSIICFYKWNAFLCVAHVHHV